MRVQTSAGRKMKMQLHALESVSGGLVAQGRDICGMACMQAR